MRLRPVALGLLGVLAIAGRSLLGRANLTCAATDAEAQQPLPGDELLGSADRVVTRAITIRRTSDAVWPWIAQLGSARGGFYSYDWLENLVGCDIHNVRERAAERQGAGHAVWR